GIIVASGRFTPEAEEFARKSGVRLIGGEELARKIREAQKAPPPLPAQPPRGEPAACGKCGAPMKLRTAKRGANAGSQFWGCSRYPACKSTRELSRAHE